MESDLHIAPISRVFRIIDSCTSENQLQSCKRISSLYARLVRQRGVINFKEVKKTLDRKILEKENELKYIETFF